MRKTGHNKITLKGYTPTITVTPKRARCRLKSPASRFFTQSFIQAQIKENITGEFPSHRASKAENISIW